MNPSNALTDFDPQRDLQLVRDVPITPEQAFEGWTVPATLMQWFCPKPWQVVDCEIDLRPGGVFANVMQGPDGVRMPRNEGSFLLVEAPHRLIWTNLLGPGFRPARPLLPGQGFGFLCELRFDPLPVGGIRYQAVVRHTDEAGKTAHEMMGFEAGWGAALGQLVALMQQRVR